MSIDPWILAYESALRSQDTNTQVGACNDLFKVGWNHCICPDLPNKQGYVHAEMMALAGNCDQRVLYVTMGCCCDCSKLLVMSGIRRLVTCKYDYSKWEKEIANGIKILKHNGIAIEYRSPAGKLLMGGELR